MLGGTGDVSEVGRDVLFRAGAGDWEGDAAGLCGGVWGGGVCDGGVCVCAGGGGGEAVGGVRDKKGKAGGLPFLDEMGA